MAEVKAYAEQCPVGGGVIHLGATSMDVQDNVDALRMLAACAMQAGRAPEAERLLRQAIGEANLRSGPGTDFDSPGTFPVGQSLRATLAQSPDLFDRVQILKQVEPDLEAAARRVLAELAG